MLSILLKSKNKIICKAEFIQVEQNKSNRNVSDVRLIKHNNECNIGEYNGARLIIDILFNTQKYGMVVLVKGIIYPDSIRDKGDWIEITGEIGFSTDYNPYDQELINHIHKYWVNNDIVDRSDFNEEDFCLYLETLATYRNFPKQLQLKPNYILEGGTIRNKCDLFIQLGEIFAGKQTYFCYGLDVLGKSLHHHFKSVDSKIPFKIKDKDAVIKKVGKKYFETMIDVLDQYFVIEL